MSIAIVSVPVPPSGDGSPVDISALVGSKTVTLSGTFKGSYVLLGSHDGEDFSPLLAFDAGGIEGIQQILDMALASVRLRSLASSARGVSASIAGISIPGSNSFGSFAPLSPGDSGPQASVDLGLEAYQEGLNFIANGGFQGAVIVEGSPDGTHFNPIGAFTAQPSPASLLASPSIVFSPLSTTDQIRYIRLNVQGIILSPFVVTFGGSQTSSADYNPAAVDITGGTIAGQPVANMPTDAEKAAVDLLVTGFAPNAVIFAGPEGELDADVATFAWDDATGVLGVTGSIVIDGPLSTTIRTTIQANSTFDISPPAYPDDGVFMASNNSLIFNPAALPIGFIRIAAYGAWNSITVPDTNAVNFPSNSDTLIGSYNTVTNNGSGTIGEYLIGAWNAATHDGTGAMHRTYGSWNIGTMSNGSGQYIAGSICLAVNSSGTASSAYGIDAAIVAAGIASTAAIGTAYGIRSTISTVQFEGGTATITNAYDFYSQNSNPSNDGYPVPPFAYGTITNYYGLYVEQHTHGTHNWSIYSAGGINYFGGSVGIGSGTTVPAGVLEISGSETIVSATSSIWDAVRIDPSTASITGNTSITTATGFNLFAIDAPTLAGNTATCTVSLASTVYIGGPPAAGANVAITKAYPLWIDNGMPRIDSTTPNGSVATSLTGVGPTGSNTTVQEWLTIDINGTTRYIPCF